METAITMGTGVAAQAARLPLNEVLCGDSLELMRQLPASSVDLVITDPPYLIGYRSRDGRTVANDTNPAGVLGAYKELYRLLKDDTYCVTFYGWSEIAAFTKAWTDAGFRTVG